MLSEKNLEDTMRIAGTVSNMYRANSHGGSELSTALNDFSKEAGSVNWALIGGLAVGFHSKPRGTQDIDLIVLNENDINKLQSNLSSFKKNRSHSFEHIKTGVEIKILTAQFLGINEQIVSQALESSENQSLQGNQIPVVNKSGLIALKLQRGSRQDLADVEAILKQDTNVDVSNYPLTEEQVKILKEIQKEINK